MKSSYWNIAKALVVIAAFFATLLFRNVLVKAQDSTSTDSSTLQQNVQPENQTIHAKALIDHECDETEWHFVINQIDSEGQAPASIHVTWANGQSADVPLDKFTGGVAHYTTTLNLDSTVTDASASIYDGWEGQFNLSHGPCNEETGTPTPTPTNTPTPSPTLTCTPTPTQTKCEDIRQCLKNRECRIKLEERCKNDPEQCKDIFNRCELNFCKAFPNAPRCQNKCEDLTKCVNNPECLRKFQAKCKENHQIKECEKRLDACGIECIVYPNKPECQITPTETPGPTATPTPGSGGGGGGNSGGGSGGGSSVSSAAGQPGQVLGASTLAATGTFTDNLVNSLLASGVLFITLALL